MAPLQGPYFNLNPQPNQKELEEQQAKVRETISDLQLKMFDKAQAYTNLILVGGYAGAFTIWSFTKPFLPMRATIVIASLLGISLFSFVTYEIFGMIMRSRHFFRLRPLMVNDFASPQEFFAEFNKIKAYDQRSMWRFVIPFWLAVLIVCVGTALAALGILGYNFYALLIDWPTWPK